VIHYRPASDDALDQRDLVDECFHMSIKEVGPSRPPAGAPPFTLSRTPRQALRRHVQPDRIAGAVRHQVLMGGAAMVTATSSSFLLW
jgi:hypothetical protein